MDSNTGTAKGSTSLSSLSGGGLEHTHTHTHTHCKSSPPNRGGHRIHDQQTRLSDVPSCARLADISIQLKHECIMIIQPSRKILTSAKQLRDPNRNTVSRINSTTLSRKPLKSSLSSGTLVCECHYIINPIDQ